MAEKKQAAKESAALDKKQEEIQADDITLEEAFLLLEATIEALESREITLEDSFKRYQQGMELLKECNEKIDTVEKKVLVLNEDGETYEF